MNTRLEASAYIEQGAVFRKKSAFALTAKAALAALMAVGLAACATVGPNYEKPQVPVSKAYQALEANSARQGTLAAPALESWWTGFNDPDLNRIIQRVLDQNLDLAAAMARVDQARAVAREVGARELPSGSLGAQVARQHQSLESPLGKIASNFPGYQRNETLSDIGAGASWELDLFGGLKRGTEAAKAEAQAAEAGSLGVRISVAAEAADAYFRVRGAQQRLVVAQDQVAANSKLLELVRLRLDNGLASSREVAQAEASVSQAKVTIPPLMTELSLQLNRLDVLMGAQPGTYAAELAQPAQGLKMAVPAIALAQGPADLLRRRPDVIAAERRLAASSARIGVATAEYYPKFSLSALIGFQALSGGSLLSAASFQPQAAAGLRWRLFDFGRVDAEVAQARGANAEALIAYRKSMLRATEDVENAVVELTQLEVQAQELDNEVAAHVRARDASEDAYRGGAVSLFEVLQEERQLLTARDQLARVHADNARAAVAAFRALGGGWGGA
ncbi:efflux transporter outer membrane subunit [Undibacterium terreum]|uniref:Transporter n=1 Tax=Undibacterium terreum TaxID=1224302 RepID=A0A916U776_9BURK|nr:transporter [Undibacterium terreum]